MDKLVFSDLALGAKFIDFPTPGDNKGHGGYKVVYWIFRKTSEYEAVNEKYGTLSSFAKDHTVISVA